MTTLRTQLRSAQAAFRSARYPGDLAGELLPTRGATVHRRRWVLAGGLGATAAAAAVVLALLLSRAGDMPRTWPSDRQQPALVDWIPVAPEGLPLPRFEAPVIPPALRLDVPAVVPGVERYEDLAMQYRRLQELAPQMPLRLRVPKLTDLPGRGAEWIHQVWEPGDADRPAGPADAA